MISLDTPLAACAALLYLGAAIWLSRTAFADQSASSGMPVAASVLAALGVLLHGASHALAWQQSGGLDMHFFAALSLVALGMAALTWAVATTRRLEALGIVVYPLAAVALLLYVAYGHNRVNDLDWRLQTHAWLALLAYATLAIAALLAMLLWLQERALRQRKFGPWLRGLPPLVQLETLLFRSIAAGFGLLTLALITGAVFVENLFAQHLIHKTVLSLLSWLVFGILLAGRWRWGWRGRKAVRLTLVAMALLGLAFFGSKFVLELVLQRG